MRAPACGVARSRVSLGGAMTPMIDVVFLLLIFFLCTASFDVQEKNLATSFLTDPAATGGGQVPTTEAPLDELESIAIVGEASGGGVAWTINNGPVAAGAGELAALLARLAAIDPAMRVTIDAAGDVPMGEVVAAYDAARAAGFGRVLLVAAPEAGR